jgi:hypothetical protein
VLKLASDVLKNVQSIKATQHAKLVPSIAKSALKVASHARRSSQN